jgi:hypothetical protein
MVKNILVEFRHGNEEFNKPMRGIKDNGIKKDVPRGLIIMKKIDVMQPSLQLVIPIPIQKKKNLERDFKLRSISNKDSNLSFLDIQC